MSRGRHEPGRHSAGQQPADERWARTSDRSTWRAYKGGLVLTVTRVADGSGWTATVESVNVTERAPVAAADPPGRSAVGR